MSKKKPAKDKVKGVDKMAGKTMVNAAGEVKQEGIMCPRCRFPMRVYRTKSLTGAIMRQRICDRCGEKVDTSEEAT